MKQLMAMVVLLTLMTTTALARSAAPQDALELVRDTTDRVLATLEENRTELERDTRRLYSLVQEHIVPHLDFRTVGRWVMGRHWREATPEQREKIGRASCRERV